MIRRPPRSTQSRSSAASDVYKRQLIDLFDFDPKNHRAGVGIVVLEGKSRNKGVGAEAIRLLTDYAFSTLALRQLFANVVVGNDASIHLFKKLGFQEVGIKKDWIFSDGVYKDEILFQKLKTGSI